MRSLLPLATVLLALLAFWYAAAALMNASLQRDQFANAGRTDYSTADLVIASLNMERPKLPAPHQIVAELDKLVLETDPTSKRSLVYHAGITLEATLIGFLIGSALGVALAVAIVSVRMLERSLMPWIVSPRIISGRTCSRLWPTRLKAHRRWRPLQRALPIQKWQAPGAATAIRPWHASPWISPLALAPAKSTPYSDAIAKSAK